MEKSTNHGDAPGPRERVLRQVPPRQATSSHLMPKPICSAPPILFHCLDSSFNIEQSSEQISNWKLTRMSRDPLDKWLDALRFEIYRLQFMPNPMHAKILESKIQEFESQPVVEIAGNDFNTALQKLETLKQDFASIQQLIHLAIELRNLRDQMREKGFLMFSPNDADEVLNGFHAWFEKTKMEQRKRQWRNFAHLRHFWPKADGPTRRQMVELFATYGRRRFKWGLMNLQIGAPLKIGRWASRMYRRY